jgi:hypothetical protein
MLSGSLLLPQERLLAPEAFFFFEVCYSCRDFLFSLGAKVVFVATNLHRENL